MPFEAGSFGLKVCVEFVCITYIDVEHTCITSLPLISLTENYMHEISHFYGTS